MKLSCCSLRLGSAIRTETEIEVVVVDAHGRVQHLAERHLEGSAPRQPSMRNVLIAAAVVEVLTGLTLMLYPSIVIQLLFGSRIAGVGVLISRLTGIALIALGVACWPDGNMLRGFFGMLTYGLFAMLFLAYVGAGGGAGILLWPAVAVHAIISAFLVRGFWNLGRSEQR